MIIREYVACETCGKHYMVRIQVGLRKVQQHIFHCVECKESIKLTLEIGVGLIPSQNCRIIPQDDEALPFYLSPDFVASAGEIHDPNSFPSFNFMRELARAVEGVEIPNDARTIEAAHKHPTWRIDEIWADIQKAWRLHDAGQYAIANRILKKLATENDIEGTGLPYIQFFLIESMIKSDSSLIDELAIIKNLNEKEFSRFVEYYQRVFKKNHSTSLYSILGDFFESFDDFTQVALYMRNDTFPPEKAHATSVNFDSVKGFYAKCYEFFAGAISIYTCLNNIKQGRPFDKLAHISLDKYLTTDKAERRKSIENNPVFFAASHEFDSNIRNAAYHDWFKLTASKQEIEYRSGGTGQLRTISYAAYLYQCSMLLAQACRLFTVELVLDDYARRTALVLKAAP